MTIDALKQSLGSSSVEERLEALRFMRERLAHETCDEFFYLAEKLVSDPDNDCRWQALIIVGEFIEQRPKDVWRVIEEHGRSIDEDMRAGVACVLLEHMLEYHFDFTYAQLQSTLRGKKDLFRATLSICRPFGEARLQWNKVERLC